MNMNAVQILDILLNTVPEGRHLTVRHHHKYADLLNTRMNHEMGKKARGINKLYHHYQIFYKSCFPRSCIKLPRYEVEHLQLVLVSPHPRSVRCSGRPRSAELPACVRGVSVVRRAPCTMDPGAQLLWPPRASASEVELSTNLCEVQNFTVHVEGPF